MDTHTQDQFGQLYFEDASWQALSLYLQANNFSQLWILTDENTSKYCLIEIEALLDQLSISFNKLGVKAGEKSKSLEVAQQLWQQLTEAGADRKAMLLNLGGGVVTDLGGFVASIYKRGIRFCHLPTSLLAMVDAAIGGKTGIDFMGYKNQLGSFYAAENVFVNPNFLNTLPEKELKSGLAEVIKHALIADKKYWSELNQFDLRQVKHLIDLIKPSVQIKQAIVKRDWNESGERKKLNFGHTVGHALESYFIDKGKEMPHGFAVAAGMICESYLSKKHLRFSELDEVEGLVDAYFHRLKFDENEIDEILEYLKQDKKNEMGRSRFTLLKSIGESVIDQEIELSQVRASLKYYIKA